VLCLLVLLRSGANYRAEELNSCQLSLAALDRFLDEKREYYAQFDDSDTCAAPWDGTTSLLAKAATLAAMRTRIGQAYRFIRTINGLNLRKKEVVFTGPAVDDIGAAPYHKLAAIQRRLSRWSPPPPRDEVGRWLTGGDLPEEASPRFASYLEYLIDKVVAQAVVETRSDLGMTRGVRDFGRFAALRSAHATKAVSEWGSSAYFCHVVPAAALAQRCSSKVLCNILNAVSARMRYNSWHYAPSYFPADQVAPERGWFSAPRMADLTVYSDYHHAGHVHARVRYCIRSPLSVRAGRDVLAGFADLRLMRQTGAPYDLHEFATALAYTEVLQFLYQKLMDHLLGSDASYVFSFGDKAWFDRAYAAQTAQAAPSQHPALA
jgi:hypothetical protein